MLEFSLDFEPDPIDVAAAMICGFKAVRRKLDEEEMHQLHGFIQETLERLLPNPKGPVAKSA